MSYREDVAHIGNDDARLAELMRLVDVLGAAAANRLLVGALWDVYPPVRNKAAVALSERMEPRLSVRLADLAEGRGYPDEAFDPPGEVTDEVRRAATLALRAWDVADGTVERLADLAEDEDAVVRYHAILALHRCADPALLHGVVEDALGDDDAAVVVVAAQIVAEHGWTDFFDRLLTVREAVEGTDRLQLSLTLSELAESRDDVPDTVVGDLLDGLRDEKTIAACAQALADLGVEEAAPRLRKVTTSWFAHPLLRVEAAAAMVILGDPEGERYLLKALEGRRKDTRGYALELIARLGLDGYRHRLVAVARDDVYHTDTAVIALGDWGDEAARRELVGIADAHPNPEIRELASSLLARDGTL